MSLTLEQITEAGPLPLGERVQNQQARNGGNANVIARRIAIEEADPKTLPRPLAEQNRELEKLLGREKHVRTNMAEQSQEWARLGRLRAGLPAQKQKLWTLENFSLICKSDVAEFETSLDTTDISTTPGWHGALQRAYSVCVAEKLLLILPRKIEQARAEIETVNTEIAALSAKFE